MWRNRPGRQPVDRVHRYEERRPREYPVAKTRSPRHGSRGQRSYAAEGIRVRRLNLRPALRLPAQEGHGEHRAAEHQDGRRFRHVLRRGQIEIGISGARDQRGI